jgi:hypothetical protein
MAHSRHVVILALVMLAMIGLTYAADAPAPIEDDGDEYLVGTRSGDPPSASGGIVAGPIGGPVPPGAFDSIAPAPSAASTVYFSTVAGTVATAAIAGFFYF